MWDYIHVVPRIGQLLTRIGQLLKQTEDDCPFENDDATNESRNIKAKYPKEFVRNSQEDIY